MDEQERLAVSPAEAARLLGLSRAMVYPLLMAGALPSVKVGARRLVPMRALQAWLDRQVAEAN